MKDPVVSTSGHSYESFAIRRALDVNPVDPKTNMPCRIEQLRPNIALKNLINDFLIGRSRKAELKMNT